MDDRGRELFEIERSPSSNWRAHIAFLLSRPLELIRYPPQREIFEAQHSAGDYGADYFRLEDSVRGARRRNGSWPIRAAFAFVAVGIALAVLAGAVVTESGRDVHRKLVKMTDIDALASALGFGIDQVALTGHKFTFDRDVFSALDLANVRSYASFDTGAVKQRIERLPWVLSAELTRVYPDRLDIRIRERTPYAVWTRGEQTFLIDETGRVLSEVSGALPVSLPRVAGEGAASEARQFFDLLRSFPYIAKRFEAADRVGERRWRVKLAKEVTLELPPDGEAQVFDDIGRDGDLMRAVDGGNVVLDFRAPGRVALSKTGEAAAKPDKPAPQS